MILEHDLFESTFKTSKHERALPGNKLLELNGQIVVILIISVLSSILSRLSSVCPMTG